MARFTAEAIAAGGYHQDQANCLLNELPDPGKQQTTAQFANWKATSTVLAR